MLHIYVYIGEKRFGRGVWLAKEDRYQKVFQDLLVVEKLYELIRLVDPLKKKVIELRSNSLTELDTKCYDFWEKGKICDNCVSMRAFTENKTFVKIEYSPNKIYMITAIPLKVDDQIIVLELLKDTTDSLLFGNADYANNSQSAMYAMIDNMNLLAMKDSLTKIYNRRYINEKLPIDLINAALSKQSIGVIMADIDYFKKVNDTYGHRVGDVVLKEFADIIVSCITRESDWVSRYGGEEFLICLPGAGLQRAIEIAEKMRRVVENHLIVFENHQIKITASFGVCSWKAAESIAIESIIENADQMLYLAKNKGRNRVEGKQIKIGTK